MTLKNTKSSLYADAVLSRRGRSADHPSQEKRRPAATHKFAVGQTVSYSPGALESPDGKGIYRVVRLLPAEGAGNQYRLQSDSGGRERVVCESQLSLG